MTITHEIKLLGTPPSPFVNRVQFVLNLKSIDYEFVEENLANKSELLLTSNPIHKKVPVLLEANKPPLCESPIIVAYLDETHPNVHPLIPSLPSDRAENRFWAHYIDTLFFPLYEELRQTLSKEGQEAVKKKMVEASELLEGAFVKLSKGKAYFGGDDVGYLDVILGCFLEWIKFVDKLYEFKTFDEVRTPRLAEWAKLVSSHEALKSVIPKNEQLVKFFMMLNIYKPPY